MKAGYLSIRRNEETILKRVKPAVDFGSRLRGLMFYRVFPDMDGMVFYPCRSVHTFWMRFVLDLILMDSGGRIVGLFEGVEPNRIVRGPSETVYVLEVSAGTVGRLKLKAAETLRWQRGN